jgi:hypothetical protein
MVATGGGGVPVTSRCLGKFNAGHFDGGSQVGRLFPFIEYIERYHEYTMK